MNNTKGEADFGQKKNLLMVFPVLDKTRTNHSIRWKVNKIPRWGWCRRFDSGGKSASLSAVNMIMHPVCFSKEEQAHE